MPLPPQTSKRISRIASQRNLHSLPAKNLLPTLNPTGKQSRRIATMTDQTRYPLQTGLFLAAIFWSGHLPPAVQAAGPGPADEPMVRELYVPFDQLPIILGAENERVFI